MSEITLEDIQAFQEAVRTSVRKPVDGMYWFTYDEANAIRALLVLADAVPNSGEMGDDAT